MFATIKNDLRQTANNIALDAKGAMDRHFACHVGGSLSGLYVRLPFTRLSLWLEWREVNVGVGIERTTGTIEFFLGRLQGLACIEPVEA